MQDDSRSTAPATDHVSARPARGAIDEWADWISRRATPGDLADLRRLRSTDLASHAFWRIVSSLPGPRGARTDGPRDSDERDVVERRWAVILRGMAETRGLHRPSRPLGAALAEARLSELRLTRLLRAGEAQLEPQVRSITRVLSSKAIPFDWWDLARLILFVASDSADNARRSIARSYFAAEAD